MRHLVPDSPDTTPGYQPGVPDHWTSSDPTSFAWSVLHRRHPLLIEQARTAHPYSPAQNDALDRLAAEATEGVVQPLAADEHDAAAWQQWAAPWTGRRWDTTPFLWAESYFYRRLLNAVDFFTPGPWYWLDPFAHQKDAELADPALDAELAALDRLADLDTAERGTALLLSALWGNRADLGFAAHATRPDLTVSKSLVVDDSAELWTTLKERDATICLVADNAGRELLADLLLVDELLTARWAGEIALHVKATPYYVSDATTADVAACMRRLARAGGYAAETAQRLQEAFRAGRVRLRTSWFYTAPLDFTAMPPDLATEFSAATLTILKGDLNYRRVFGDRHWPATTAAAQAGGYFPGRFAVLRTLKSDVVVGVPESRLDELDAGQPQWRVSGTHAMVQVVA